MPDDILDANNNANSGAPPAPPARKFTCVGCGCTMTGDGQSIWSMGEKYATFMKLSETHAKAIEKLNEEIARLSGALTEARKELDTLKASEQTQRAIGEKILRT